MHLRLRSLIPHPWTGASRSFISSCWIGLPTEIHPTTIRERASLIHRMGGSSAAVTWRVFVLSCRTSRGSVLLLSGSRHPSAISGGTFPVNSVAITATGRRISNRWIRTSGRWMRTVRCRRSCMGVGCFWFRTSWSITPRITRRGMLPLVGYA